MICEESEAGNLWCPFARVALSRAPEGSAFNRLITQDGNTLPAGKCLGAGCMAWRWADPEFERHRSSKVHGEPVSPPEGNGWKVERQDMFSMWWSRPWPMPRRGFCGLAEPRPAEVQVSS